MDKIVTLSYWCLAPDASPREWLSCRGRPLLWMKIHSLALVPGTGRGGAGHATSVRRYRGGVFTGLVREVGLVVSLEGGDAGVRLVLEAPATAHDAGLGDSISIDGVCLTVVVRTEETLAFDAVPETLDRTALATLEPGSRVNLEPALRAGEPLGGHYVQGHVDGVGSVRSVEPEGDGQAALVRSRARAAALHRREGLRLRAGRQPDGRGRRRGRLRRRADPAHARCDESRRLCATARA